MAVIIFPRYLIKTLLPYLAFAVIVFSAVLFMNQFVRVFNTAIIIGASLDWVFYSLMLLMPMVLALSLPMAFQLAVLLALTGLSEQGEILALRAAGFSVKQIVWPLGAAAVALFALLMWINNWVSPWGFKKFQNSQHFMAESISKLRITPKTFIDIGDWKLYAEDVRQSSGKLYRVHLFRYPDSDGNTATIKINAPEGRCFVSARKGFGIELKNGDFQRVDPDDTRRVIMARFSSYKVFIPFGSRTSGSRSMALTELTTPEIFRELKGGGLAELRRAEYKIEAATRLAMAFSPVVFFWLSCPLGLAAARRNRAWGMILSIAILFAFYGVLASGISVGRKIYSLAWIGPVLADIAGVAAGMFFWRKKLGS